ncbi:hypothetical protein [Streptomyces sp. NPDC049881]|uniref:hypothetical protein n=1 Tax=Streptomyces sp. NPDC049881 TaxID=3155778 RepID=UPI00342D8DFA
MNTPRYAGTYPQPPPVLADAPGVPGAVWAAVGILLTGLAHALVRHVLWRHAVTTPLRALRRPAPPGADADLLLRAHTALHRLTMDALGPALPLHGRAPLATAVLGTACGWLAERLTTAYGPAGLCGGLLVMAALTVLHAVITLPPWRAAMRADRTLRRLPTGDPEHDRRVVRAVVDTHRATMRALARTPGPRRRGR